MLAAIPLLAIAVIAYNVAALILRADLAHPLFAIDLPSGAAWSLSTGDLLICLALILLFFEVLKATRAIGAAILDHVASMALFVICLLEFLLVPACGTSVFLVITLTTFIDVIAGFSVGVASARRDISVTDRL